MPHIDRASRVSIDTLQKTLKQMDSNIRNLQTDITNNKVPQSDDDKFLDVMEVSFFFFYKISYYLANILSKHYRHIFVCSFCGGWP